MCCCNAFRNAHTTTTSKPPNNCTNKIVIKMHFHLMQNDINLIQLLESAKRASHYLWSYGDAKGGFNEAHLCTSFPGFHDGFIVQLLIQGHCL